jgi:hypothetical protein
MVIGSPNNFISSLSLWIFLFIFLFLFPLAKHQSPSKTCLCTSWSATWWGRVGLLSPKMEVIENIRWKIVKYKRADHEVCKVIKTRCVFFHTYFSYSSPGSFLD